MIRPLAFSAPRSIRPWHLPRYTLGAEWAPVGLALLTAVAFWRSVGASLPLLGADSPAGLTPIMPALAVWLAVASVRSRRAQGLPLKGQREGAIDVPAAAAVLGAAAWLMWAGPTTHGWYFWASRYDLLALPLFAVGVAILVWGLQATLRHKIAIAFSFLVWPVPLLEAQEWMAGPLAETAARLARPLALAAGAALTPVGRDPTVFRSAGGEPWTLIVGDACSGLNAGLLVALVSVPAALQYGLPFVKWLPWMMAGVALSVASNVARVAGIVVAADRMGVEPAMATVHNLLGAVLLCAVFLVVWLIMPTGRQAPTTVLAASAPGAPSVATAGSATALASLPTLTRGRVMLLGGAGAFAWASARLGGFQPLPPVGPPGAAVNTNIEYLRLPPGWRSEAQGELPVQNLFGPDSKTYWLNLRHDDGSRILAQLITTPDRNKLRQYGIEACRIFHGGDVVGTRAVALGGGATATLIDTIDRRDRELHERLSVLYWEAPFSLRGRSGEMHARVALFIEQSDERLLSTVAEAGVAPGGAAFDKAATALLQLGRSITQGISHPGTPGFTVPRLVPPARPSKLPNAAASNDGRYS